MTATARAESVWGLAGPGAEVIPLRPRNATPPPARGQGRVRRSVTIVLVAAAAVVLSLASLVVILLGPPSPPTHPVEPIPTMLIDRQVAYDVGGLTVTNSSGG